MIKFCKTCLMPNTRPRIVFNQEDICNACVHSKKKIEIDWKSREKEFLEIVKKIKNQAKENKSFYHCVVPWSGGKDSTSIAIKLKFEYGLNPLLVTFSPLIVNECGENNRKELIKLGFDSVFLNPNYKVARALSKRFFVERGNPKVAWDAGINSAPVNVAINYRIPTIFYAEHGESEYGGLVLNKESEKKRDLREVIEHCIGDYPENWETDEIKKEDLAPYSYPEEKQLKKLNIYYFAYFFKWSMYENYLYVKKNLKGFQTNPFDRTEGTFTNFDSLDDKIDDLYYYMQYIKFGFGRCSRDASRMINSGHLTREKGIEYLKEYDGEFPKRHLTDVLKYYNISEIELETIINKHRNEEIWKQSNNDWTLNLEIK